jgi:ribosomal protein S18 acetylase RimI-like enzyme
MRWRRRSACVRPGTPTSTSSTRSSARRRTRRSSVAGLATSTPTRSHAATASTGSSSAQGAVGTPALGYLIAYDLAARGYGVYVKRVVVADKGRGVGRAALAAFVRHAFDDLDADAVWLTVFADNLRAQRAYLAAGFDERVVTAEERTALQAAVGGFSATSLVLRCARRPGAG